jgi:hypothetical protein
MSLRKARSCPTASGAALRSTRAAKAAVVREKTVVIGVLAAEPWGSKAKTSAPAA